MYNIFTKLIGKRRLCLQPKLLLTMKITVLLLIMGFVRVSAATYAQEVSLNVKNASLTEVFALLRSESGYNFLYDADVLEKTNKVTLSIKKIPFVDALNLCFKNQPVSYVISDKNVVIRKNEQAPVTPAAKPRINVTGSVKDDTGGAMPGVTVTLKGTTLVTTTDNKGLFSLSVPTDDGVLVFSSVGYEPVEEPLKSRTVINVRLKAQITNLTDVVVVAYGTQKKVDLTGAVQQISGEDLQNRPVPDISAALQGLMAGLNVTTTSGGGGPGATKAINVRGFTNLSGGLGGPLVLVDGVETGISTINPNDIESVTLLKDAASSALYGSRAPYGVLLIVTKHGKKNSPMSISYSNNFSAGQPIGVPVESNSLTFAQVINEGNENGGGGQLIPDAVINRIKAYIADPTHVPDNIPQPNSPNNWSYNNVGFANANTDWFKVFIKKWTQDQQHNLSVSGGSDKTSYFVGASTDVYNGTYNYINDSYTRDNLRANLTTDINKYITFKLQTNYAHQITYGIDPYTQSNWFQTMAFNWPLNPLIDPNGGYDYYSQVPVMKDGGINKVIDDQYRISGDLIVKPLPGLTLTGHYNYDLEFYNQFISALVFNYSTVPNPNTPHSLTVSQVTKSWSELPYYDYNMIANYEHRFGYHYFKIQVGQ
jgi:TonB-linked SusC/RagA family outer membrane protein